MKRIVALLLTAVMLMAMLSACGAKNQIKSTDFTIPAGGYDGSKVTIKFAHTMGGTLQTTLEYHIKEFNKLYPNITIEHDTYGSWSDIAGQINVENTGGNAPNIAYCYPDHVATYKLSKSVVALDNLIDSTEKQKYEGGEGILGLTQEQKDDFIEGFYNEGKVYGDGKMYTLPMSKSTEVLYYNKTFFEENNIQVPTNWEEMKNVCKQLKELDPKCIPLGYDSEENLFITMCQQYGYAYTTAEGEGSDHYLFNNDDCKAFVKEMREWYQAGYITTQAIYGSYTSSLFTEVNKDKQHSYMCIGSTGGASYQIPDTKSFEVGVAPIPQVNKDKPQVISQGPSLCILRGKKTTDQQILASWLFVKYLTTDMAFQTEFSSRSGYMPVIKSAQENETYKNWLQGADGGSHLPALVVQAALAQAEGYFTSQAFSGSSAAREQVGLILFHAMSDPNPDIDKLFADAFDKCVFYTA